MIGLVDFANFLLEVPAPVIETACRKWGCAGALLVLAAMALIGVLIFRLIAG